MCVHLRDRQPRLFNTSNTLVTCNFKNLPRIERPLRASRTAAAQRTVGRKLGGGWTDGFVRLGPDHTL
jgi:hypothetical protein